MRNRDIWIAFTSAIIGFSGAITAPYFSSIHDQNNWEERFQLNYKSEIVNKRISLIETMIGLKVELLQYERTYEQLMINIKADKAVLDCKYAQLNEKFDPEDCDSNSLPVEYDKYFTEMSRIQILFMKTASMSAYFFGPQSREVLSQLNSPASNWSKQFEAISDELISTLYSELHYFDERP